MSETLIITQERIIDGITYDVIFIEASRVARTKEDSARVILESYGLDETEVEEALLDMKSQNLL